MSFTLGGNLSQVLYQPTAGGVSLQFGQERLRAVVFKKERCSSPGGGATEQRKQETKKMIDGLDVFI